MRYSKIKSDLFARNREKLVKRLAANSIVIVNSNDEMPRNGDQYFPFRQNSNLFYLTGIVQEKTSLVLYPDNKNKELREVLFIRKSSSKLEIWEGRKLNPDEAREISGIETIRWADEFNSVLAELMTIADNVYLNIPENPKFNPEIIVKEYRFESELKKKYPLHKYNRLAPLINEMRLIKEPEEIELIRKSCEITRDAFIKVLAHIRAGITEYEIEAVITHEFLKRGAGGHAFQPIVASGANACVLHYIKNNIKLKKGELVLLDFGSEYANYAADCSRTLPVEGRFSRRQKELYNSTLRVFKYARSIMKKGTTINKLHKKVTSCWEEEHIKLGLYTGKDLKKQNKDEPLWGKYYLHGTSHFMGLDVHDVGNKDVELKPGMVLTCEPGIYIPAEKTGIRIENDILITENGNVDLMDSIPVEPEEIEMLMHSERH
jgi:Xaa-Pro aminopeptidase